MGCSTSSPRCFSTGTGDLLIYVKIHRSFHGSVIAACDENLIGKVLEEGEIVVDIKSYSDFYKGDLIPPKDLGSVIVKENIVSANVIGKEAVKAAIDSGVIDEDHVRRIGEVPYAHAYRVD